MNKQKKLLETWLFSTGGLVVLAVVLCLVNFLLDAANLRLDLTEENLQTAGEKLMKVPPPPPR